MNHIIKFLGEIVTKIWGCSSKTQMERINLVSQDSAIVWTVHLSKPVWIGIGSNDYKKLALKQHRQLWEVPRQRFRKMKIVAGRNTHQIGIKVHCCKNRKWACERSTTGVSSWCCAAYRNREASNEVSEVVRAPTLLFSKFDTAAFCKLMLIPFSCAHH